MGEFKLSSGLTSPYYVDLRTLPSYPELFRMVTDAYVSKLEDMDIGFDRIAGIAVAGIPIATLVAHKLNKPLLYIRKEDKTHGIGRSIEGVVRAGNTILIIDDVATTGESLHRATKTLRGCGAKVEYAMVLVDREQGAKRNLETMGVKLLSLITASELIRELYSKNIISGVEYEKIVKYIERWG
jgi:orotate phosphoribosyltransferase